MSVNDVYTKLRTAPAYHPASVDLFDDCTLQAGDVVTVRSGNDSYTLPIFFQHLVWNGASTLQLESTGNEKRSDLPPLRKRELNTSYGLGSGAHGAQKSNEEKFKKYETHFEQTDEYFSLLATESEWDELAQEGHVTAYTQILQTARDITSVAAKTGIDGLAEDETLYSKINQNAESITSEVTRAKGEEVTLSSRITQNAESIMSKVSKGEISSTINQTAQSVLIQASKIDLEGYVTVDELEATNASIANLTTGGTTAQVISTIALRVSNGFTFRNHIVESRPVTVGTKRFSMLSINEDQPNSIVYSDLPHYHAITASENAGKIALTLGAAQETEGTANFNIADTQCYKDGVSAARSGVTLTGRWKDGIYTATASNGKTVSTELNSVELNGTPSKSGTHFLVVPVKTVATGNLTVLTDNVTVNAQSIYDAGAASVSQRSVSSVAVNGTITWSSNSLDLTVPVKVMLSDGSTWTGSLTVDGTKAYNAGAADGADGVGLSGGAASTSNIVWNTTIRKIGSVTGKVTVKLSNGKTYSRTVSDITAPSVRDVNVNTLTDKCTVYYKNVTSGYTASDVFDW